MKLPILLLVLLSACSPKVTQTTPETYVRYYYVLQKPAQVFAAADVTSRQLKSLAKGDTITTFQEPVDLQEWQAMERQGYLIYVRRPSLTALRPKYVQHPRGYKPSYLSINKYPGRLPDDNTP
ncbi:hypothetical protein BH09BAC4_BH09BAC4_03110 [soil metagenome]